MYHFVYALYSPDFDKIYIGGSGNIKARKATIIPQQRITLLNLDHGDLFILKSTIPKAINNSGTSSKIFQGRKFYRKKQTKKFPK